MIITDTDRETLLVKGTDSGGIVLIHVTKGAFPDIRMTTEIELDPDQIDELLVYMIERVVRKIKKEKQR